MSRLAWMPLYVGDYLADTQHLGAYESGAYLHLLMHYWQCGGLPSDEASLCRIAKVHPPHWKRIRASLAPFFSLPDEGGSWVSKRLDLEIAKRHEISNKRKEAAKQKQSKSSANAELLHTQPQPQSQKNYSVVEGEVPDELLEPAPDPTPAVPEPPPQTPTAGLFRRGREVLGRKSGGVVTKLLRSKGGDVNLARAVLETAASAGDPMEYVVGATRRAEESSQESRDDLRRKGRLI